MNPLHFAVLLPGAVASAVFSAAASAGVIPDSQITFQTGVAGASYDVDVVKTPNPAGGATSVRFAYTGTTLAVTSHTFDQESDWYLTDSGDLFTAGEISAGQFPVIFTIDNPRPPVAIPLGNFYLAVATTDVSAFPPPPGRSVFGWLELDNTGIALVPVANAVDYGDGGIIVGTTTAIPEPASLALLAAPVALLAVRRRRRA